MKKDLAKREKEIDELENLLVQEALKLPNKTHYDSPIGDESKNKVIKEYDNQKLSNVVVNHMDIAKEFDLLDF